MIGFSIMMWFVAIVLLFAAMSLLKGNTAGIHGKVFSSTKDKTGYAKALGKVILFMSIGMLVCGIVVLIFSDDMAIIYALIVLIIVTAVAGIWGVVVQRRYRGY